MKERVGWRAQVTPFQRKVYEAILRIPRGQVRTYAEVARMVGKPQAARAVGQALKRNRWAPRIPCHRVVSSKFLVQRRLHGPRKIPRSGMAWRGLGGYSCPGGPAAKRRLLEREKAPRFFQNKNS